MKPWMKTDHSIFTPFIFRMLFVLFFVEFVKGALLVTVLPVYMNSFLGLSAYTVGWALALQYAGDNLFRTPMGFIVDRIGYRIGIVVGVVLSGVSVWIMAVADQGVWMIAAATLLGIGTSPLWPSVIAGATAEAGEHVRGTMMSIVYAAWLSGTGLGPVVINFFIRETTYRPAFWFLGGVLLCVLAVSLFLPDKHKQREQAQSVIHTARQTGLWARLKAYIATVRSTVDVSPLFYPALFLQNASIGLLAPVITLYAKDVLQLSNMMYSLFLVFGGGVTILLLYPSGKLVDRYGTRWLLHIGFLLGSAAIAMFALTTERTLVWIMVALIGFSYALIIPAWNAMIASYVPADRRALIWGFFLTIEGGGMVVGSILSGRLWDSFGPQAPFFVSGLAMLTLFVLHLFISKPQQIVIR